MRELFIKVGLDDAKIGHPLQQGLFSSWSDGKINHPATGQ